MATFATPESRTLPLDAHILLAEELSRIAEHAQSLTSATGVMIALRRSHELVIRMSNGIAPEVGACIPLPSGVTGLCVTTKKPQTCASADAEAQLEGVFRALSVRSILSVPIEWDGEVRGVLAVLAQMPEAFNRTHIAVLTTLRAVTANILSQCGLPSDSPLQAAPDPGQVVEFDLDSLLNAPAPEPTLVPPKPAAPAPPKASAVPAQPATPVAPPRVEPAPAAPVARTEQRLPLAPPSLSQPAARPLAALLKEPAETPVEMSPDVLCPGEDPREYGSVLKPKPVVRPAARATARAVHSTSTVLAAYRAPAKSNRKNILVFAGSAAAVVVLGLAVALYPRHKPGPAAPAAAPSISAQETPAPAVAPSLVAVTLPKSAGEHPPAAAAPSEPTAPPAAPANRKEAERAAEEPKRAVEETVPEPASILHLASGKPAARSEEPIEPPALGVMAASGKALPNLPTLSVPTPSAVRKPVFAPAALVQGRPPQYPEAAKRLGVSGAVKLRISISADGKVTDVRALNGHPFLQQESITAVREWVFRPASLDGKPVPSTAEVSVRFNAPGNPR